MKQNQDLPGLQITGILHKIETNNEVQIMIKIHTMIKIEGDSQNLQLG